MYRDILQIRDIPNDLESIERLTNAPKDDREAQ
jgi:hypothetical protein